jgi:flagellar FliL protein
MHQDVAKEGRDVMSEEKADGLEPKKSGLVKILFLVFNAILFLAGVGFFALTKMDLLASTPAPGAQAVMQPCAPKPQGMQPSGPQNLGGGQPCAPPQKVQLNPQVPAHAAKATPMLVQMKPFVVNLRGDRGRRYLRVSMEVEVLGEQGKSTMEEHASRVRNRLIFLLSNKTVQEINTTEGKYQLQEDITQQINETIGIALATKTYFTDFIVQ